MTDHPMVQYKPGLTMDTPIPITMAAADWAMLMSWYDGLPNEWREGAINLFYHIMAPQISEALYTPASIKGAKAAIDERRSQNPLAQIFGQIGTITAEEAKYKTIYVIQCAECESRDEYDDTTAHGELTCGHNGLRSLITITRRLIDEK